MFRSAVVAALTCLGVALACPLTPARAAEGDAFNGNWQVDHDGYNEIWTIKKDKDDWSVAGVFKDKGKEVGSWKGTDVKFADGKLTCTQTYVVKPNPTWSDGTKLTAAVKGDKLTFLWDNGNGQSGTRDMVRVKPAAADGADLVGIWKVDHDGYTEVWTVQADTKGQWGVSGLFLKKGKQVGAFVGADPKFADGKLTCTQKWLVKPVATWSDGNTLTGQISGDKLSFTWDDGKGGTGSQDMTKVK